jgi:hypothetical protein
MIAHERVAEFPEECCAAYKCRNVSVKRGMCARHYTDYHASRPYPCVYAIKAHMEPPRIKIGCSSDIKSRFRALKTDCPVEIELLGGVSGSFDLERVLHKALKEYRIIGEWFRYDGPVVDVVTAIKSEDYGVMEDFLLDHVIPDSDMSVQERINILLRRDLAVS